MHLVVIGWLYVAVMMSVAEATSPRGTVLGALFTFLLYGLLPVALVVYLMFSPARRRAVKAREAAAREAAMAAAASKASVAPASIAPASVAPDAGGEPATDAVAPVGEKK